MKTTTLDPRTAATTNDEVLRKLSVAFTNLGQVTEDARAALDNEHKMGTLEAIRLHPKAVFFSMVLSFSIVMEVSHLQHKSNLLPPDPSC